ISWLLHHVILCFTGLSSPQEITPYTDAVLYTPTEGSSVSLRCTYETSSDYVYLYWYRHYPNQAPQFLLYKGARSWSSDEHIPDKRYTSTTSRESTELVITSLTLADTAIYYCALGDYTQ
uniref:Ig-like domain-containing protein n=1 Tax=Oncorhynchus mykiss TaxID=8022 RepID=A0A8K9V3Z9_ONCMY